MLPAYLKAHIIDMSYVSDSSSEGLISYKASIVTKEDLYSSPTPNDVKKYNNAIDELNKLAEWIAAFKSTKFGEAYTNQVFDTPSLKQLLIKTQTAGESKSIYGKLKYTKQQDRWKFLPLAFEAPAVGKPKDLFKGDFVIQGSSEAKQQTALVEATSMSMRRLREEVEKTYKTTLLASTSVGTKYIGTVAHRRGTFKVELEFTSQEQDGRFLTFTLRNLSDPSYEWQFAGRLDSNVPTKNNIANLIVNCVAAKGKSEYSTAPGNLVNSSRSEVLLEIQGKEISGIVGSYNGDHKLLVNR